jgi:hypothetical protein
VTICNRFPGDHLYSNLHMKIELCDAEYLALVDLIAVFRRANFLPQTRQQLLDDDPPIRATRKQGLSNTHNLPAFHDGDLRQ